MQVKDLTIEEFKCFIQETVTETLETLLSEPDFVEVNGVHDKHQDVEEPDEGKLSRPVLKLRVGSDPFALIRQRRPTPSAQQITLGRSGASGLLDLLFRPHNHIIKLCIA